MSRLPGELLDQIIDHLAEDANSNNALARGIRHDIAACALASRILRDRCQRHLFRTIVLDSNNHDHLRQLTAIFVQSPHIAAFVVELTLALHLQADVALTESRPYTTLVPVLCALSNVEALNLEQVASDRAFLYCFPIAFKPVKYLNIRGRFCARPGPLFGAFLVYFPAIVCLKVQDFAFAGPLPPPSPRHYDLPTDTLVTRFILQGTHTDAIFWDTLTGQRQFRDLKSVEMSGYDCESLAGLSLASDAFERLSSLKVTSSTIKGRSPSGNCEALLNWLQQLDVSFTSHDHRGDTALWWIRTMAGYDMKRIKSITVNVEVMSGGVFSTPNIWESLYHALKSKTHLKTMRIHAFCWTKDRTEGENLGKLIMSACLGLGEKRTFSVRVTNVAQSLTFFEWSSSSNAH
ncbi:hypothetical protein BDZ89DRAFT_1058718 [Hymenopellis radicata]|nr:hypothetical protein BDZ89DRAFT_1058718 [Hymenopellis radicata]